MIISNTGNFAFVHIPKNGGTSVRKALSQYGEDPRFTSGRVTEVPQIGPLDHVHIPLSLLKDLYPDALDEIRARPSFAIVRDPYTRFQSALNQWAKNVKKERLMDLPQQKVAQYAKLHLEDRDPHENMSPSLIHFLPQTEFIFLDNTQIVDLLVPFERLNTSWPEILGHIGVDRTLTLSKENPSIAGSVRRIFEQIPERPFPLSKSCSHSMKKILVLCRYGALGASSRLRFLQYLNPLEKQGEFEFTVAPLLTDEYLSATYSKKTSARIKLAFPTHINRLKYLLMAKKFDCIWLQSEIFPFFPAWFERTLNGLKIPYVVDYDDAIFHRYDRSNNTLIRTLFGRKIATVMKSAKVVTVGNEYLADHAKKAGCQNVVEIPTVVDETRYTPKKNLDQGPLTLGWIGTPATAKYLEPIAPALDQLGSERDLNVHLVGAGPSVQKVFKVVKPKIIDWTEDTEAQEIQKFSIGIMPLAGNDWDEGKCGYKIVQYMASGVPSLATYTRANDKIITAGACGETLDKKASTEDWIDAIRSMTSGQTSLLELGRSGRKAVENIYSVNAQLPRIRNSLLSAMKN